MAATGAGIPSFSRRKSIERYCFLCPPPRCQIVTSPWALRPPERFFGSTSAFSGVCLVISLLSSMVTKRRDAVYGLKLFSAITLSFPLARPAGLRCHPRQRQQPNPGREPPATDYPRTRSSFPRPPTLRKHSSNLANSPPPAPATETPPEKFPFAHHTPQLLKT